jgi:hypothetical protein
VPLALKAAWPEGAPAPDEAPEFEVRLRLAEDDWFTYLLTPGAGVADVILPDGVYEVGPGYVPFGYRFVLLSADGEESDGVTVTVAGGAPDCRGVTLVYEQSGAVFGRGLTVDFLVGPGPEDPEAPEDPETPETPETPEDPETSEAPETPEGPVTSETPETPEGPVTSGTPETPDAVEPEAPAGGPEGDDAGG